MQYTLEKIFQEGLNGFIRLQPGVKCDIELEPDQTRMAYIDIDQNMNPVVFSLTPIAGIVEKKGQVKVDIRVHMSMNQKDPSEKAFEKNATNVNTLKSHNYYRS